MTRSIEERLVNTMDVMYSSTRNASEKYTASKAILQGLAPDGGLFVPSFIPKFDKSVL